VNCSGGIDSLDALDILLEVSHMPVPGACGASMDMNCNGTPDAVDALYVLLYVARLGVPVFPGCPQLGV
jgi:hypothetical protein